MEMPPPSLLNVEPATPFAEEVRRLALENWELGPARDAVVFYGSSSFRLWETLVRDFPSWRVLNRGFGGSTLPDQQREFERLVVPLQPQALALYAGDNDLDNGASPEHVRWCYELLLEAVRQHLGGLPVVMLAIKPSPIRYGNVGRIRHTNELLQAVAAERGALFVDVFTPMMQADGAGPRRELFGEDGLHLSAAGYALWTTLLTAALPPPAL